MIGSELAPSKAARARAHLEAAGVADLVDRRESDALETLADPGCTVDLLLLEGWKRALHPGSRRGESGPAQCPCDASEGGNR